MRPFPSRSVAFVAFVAFCVLFCGLPAHAQVQFNGEINTQGMVATIANPVYYSETITGLSVTQAGWLPCTVYPTVGVYVLRGGAELTLSSTQLSSGTVVNIPFSFSTLQAGDVVTAQETAPGQGCPFTGLVVTLTAQYTVTLSANLSSLAAGAIGSNGFIRVTPQNCGSSNPEIQGAGIIVAFRQDFYANAQGQVTGTLTATTRSPAWGRRRRITS